MSLNASQNESRGVSVKRSRGLNTSDQRVTSDVKADTLTYARSR